VDNRFSPRKRVVQSGKILLQGGGAFDCRIRDRSADGARLKVAAVVGIPQTFTLRIEPEGQQHEAEIVWRTTNEVGVRFTSAAHNR